MFHAVKITNSYGLELNYIWKKVAKGMSFQLFFRKTLFTAFFSSLETAFASNYCRSVYFAGRFLYSQHNRDVGPKKVKLFIGHT
jgi:hypothetical protein